MKYTGNYRISVACDLLENGNIFLRIPWKDRFA